MISFFTFIIFGALFQDASAESPKRDHQRNHHVQKRFFNALFKSDSTFFKLQKPPRYLAYVDLQKNMQKTTKIMDFWMCADGREVLLILF